VPVDEGFAAAAQGATQAEIGPAAEAAAGPGDLGSPTVLREYLPLQVDHEVHGVVAIWRDARPILDRLDIVRREVVLLTLSASLVAAALLFLIFRSAQGRLTRQTAALVDATRRDPLTGTLNHGSLVGLLAAAIESSRDDGRPLGIALVDVDNFRLLNDNHGHGAGDDALLAVAGILEAQVDPSMTMGRYGPDEFLVVAPSADIASLEPMIARLGAALVDLSLRFDETERLPVTISVGIAMYPEHASSVTALLSAAVQALGEAKASGGDAVRIAGPVPVDEAAAASTFDVLQGLVVAVDTKDRYTKRHSEDVARYATFLAERLGRPADEIRTIGVAGLLHDVGKIGIPDHILRKPGRLSEAEYEAVKQHVALGDMIVRDLPDVDSVRAGIRHHHERWDGDGYLDRLEGEEIPLIARILAVADAFSAMTTTRPYRKAFDVREALVRLGDAAGTQLDERLVQAFIEGIEGADAPPLPGDGAAGRLWLPGRRVA
jgi:diguanylate cyclase (GGDEF)-like protein